MEISPEKSKKMALLGQDPVRCKTAVDNKCLKEENNFKYFGFEISFRNEKYAEQKLTKFAQTLGILKNIYQPNLVQKL